MEKHYDLYNDIENKILNIYWFESFEYVKKRFDNYNIANKLSGFKNPSIRIFKIEFMEV